MSNNNFTAVVMSDKIQVAIKVRPLVTREKEVGEFWRVNGNSLYPVNFDKQRSGEIFAYDHVFADNSTNMEVFEKVVKPLVNRAVRGFNATIFAYGQTSSGKTHTMLGDQNEAGITQLAVSSMFDFMKKSGGREFLVRASYMEIYNDRVNDLLEQQNNNLKIREEDGKIVVQRLKEELVADSAEVMSLLKRGQEIRRIGETNLNERSSRSHTIFRLIIESRESDMGDETQVSQLNFVDLAGSESAGLAGTTGERLKEGCAINQSLFQLSQVVAQLSEGSQFVNFRDSKLTRILQCSLGGNAHTLIICTVTPASVDFTLSTLRFASRAKAVKNKPQVNVVMPDGTQNKYARQLEKFQAELKATKKCCACHELEAVKSKLEEKERLNSELQQQINVLMKTRIVAEPVPKPRFNGRRTSGRGHLTPLDLFKGNLATLAEDTSLVLTNDDFNTPNEDFEVQLIEDEREKGIEMDILPDSESPFNLGNSSFGSSIPSTRASRNFSLSTYEECKEIQTSASIICTPVRHHMATTTTPPSANTLFWTKENKEHRSFVGHENDLILGHENQLELKEKEVEVLQKSLNEKEELLKEILSFQESLTMKLVECEQDLKKTHKDALDMLLDPLVSPKDLQPWQHRFIVQALLSQGQHTKALEYFTVRQLPVQGIEDIQLKITLLVMNKQVTQAYNFLQQYHNEENNKELLVHFYRECGKAQQLETVLKLMLSPGEEDLLMNYLQSCNISQSEDMQVVFYLMRSRETTPVVFPSVTSSIKRRIDDDGGIPASSPLKRSRLENSSPVDNFFPKIKKSVHDHSVSSSGLLKTPLVKRVTPMKQFSASSTQEMNVLRSFAETFTPQSILKVRNLVRSSVSPEHSRGHEDDLLSREHSKVKHNEEKVCSRQIRFSLPVSNEVQEQPLSSSTPDISEKIKTPKRIVDATSRLPLRSSLSLLQNTVVEVSQKMSCDDVSEKKSWRLGSPAKKMVSEKDVYVFGSGNSLIENSNSELDGEVIQMNDRVCMLNESLGEESFYSATSSDSGTSKDSSNVNSRNAESSPLYFSHKDSVSEIKMKTQRSKVDNDEDVDSSVSEDSEENSSISCVVSKKSILGDTCINISSSSNSTNASASSYNIEESDYSFVNNAPEVRVETPQQSEVSSVGKIQQVKGRLPLTRVRKSSNHESSSFIFQTVKSSSLETTKIVEKDVLTDDTKIEIDLETEGKEGPVEVDDSINISDDKSSVDSVVLDDTDVEIVEEAKETVHQGKEISQKYSEKMRPRTRRRSLQIESSEGEAEALENKNETVLEESYSSLTVSKSRHRRKSSSVQSEPPLMADVLEDKYQKKEISQPSDNVRSRTRRSSLPVESFGMSDKFASPRNTEVTELEEMSTPNTRRRRRKLFSTILNEPTQMADVSEIEHRIKDQDTEAQQTDSGVATDFKKGAHSMDDVNASKTRRQWSKSVQSELLQVTDINECVQEHSEHIVKQRTQSSLQMEPADESKDMMEAVNEISTPRSRLRPQSNSVQREPSQTFEASVKEGETVNQRNLKDPQLLKSRRLRNSAQNENCKMDSGLSENKGFEISAGNLTPITRKSCQSNSEAEMPLGKGEQAQKHENEKSFHKEYKSLHDLSLSNTSIAENVPLVVKPAEDPQPSTSFVPVVEEIRMNLRSRRACSVDLEIPNTRGKKKKVNSGNSSDSDECSVQSEPPQLCDVTKIKQLRNSKSRRGLSKKKSKKSSCVLRIPAPKLPCVKEEPEMMESCVGDDQEISQHSKSENIPTSVRNLRPRKHSESGDSQTSSLGNSRVLRNSHSDDRVDSPVSISSRSTVILDMSHKRKRSSSPSSPERLEVRKFQRVNEDIAEENDAVETTEEIREEGKAQNINPHEIEQYATARRLTRYQKNLMERSMESTKGVRQEFHGSQLSSDQSGEESDGESVASGYTTGSSHVRSSARLQEKRQMMDRSPSQSSKASVSGYSPRKRSSRHSSPAHSLEKHGGGSPASVRSGRSTSYASSASSSQWPSPDSAQIQSPLKPRRKSFQNAQHALFSPSTKKHSSLKTPVTTTDTSEAESIGEIYERNFNEKPIQKDETTSETASVKSLASATSSVSRNTRSTAKYETEQSSKIRKSKGRASQANVHPKKGVRLFKEARLGLSSSSEDSPTKDAKSQEEAAMSAKTQETEKAIEKPPRFSVFRKCKYVKIYSKQRKTL